VVTCVSINITRVALCVCCFPGSKTARCLPGHVSASLPRPRDRQRHTKTAGETAAAADLARSVGRPQLAHGIRAPRAPSTHPSRIATTTAGDELGARLLELTRRTRRAATAPRRCECDRHAVHVWERAPRACLGVARPREVCTDTVNGDWPHN
jgi:hypothetical protein